MKKILLILLAVFSPALLFGQGVMVPPQSAFKVVNGVTTPIANATITVCAANTGGYPCSPPLVGAIFKDAALTQPLSNPFTTDSAGNYQFASAPGNYTVTQTASGFAGYSYQITASSSSTTAGLADPGQNGVVFRNGLNTTRISVSADVIALFSGTCNVSAFLRGDGSCAPTSSTVFNVLTYGAKCDGVTDDSTAFTSAIAAAANGGTVFIPPSTLGCYLASTLTISANGINLQGAAWNYGAHQAPSTLLFAAGINGVVSSGDAIRIQDIAIVSKDVGANTDVGLRMTGGRPLLERVLVQSFGSHGVLWDSSTAGNVDHWYANSLRALSNFGDGFRFTGGADENVGTGVDMDATLNGGIGFDLVSGASTNTFITPHASQNTGGDYNVVSGSSNYFLNAYCESGVGPSFTIGASASFNQVVFPNFGLCSTITNNGGQSNQIYYSYQSSPGVTQLFINPPAGTAGGAGKTFEISSGIFNPKDLDIRDVTGAVDLLDYNNSLADWNSLVPWSFTNFAAATSGGSTNSGIAKWMSSCWNGSTAQNDFFTTQVLGGAGTNGTAVLTFDTVAGCSGAHSVNFKYPVTTTFLTSTAGGALALSTTAIGAHTCSAAQTLTVTGTTTSSQVGWSFASTPIGVTGYGDATTPFLVVTAFPTANTANIVVCNTSAASITPGAISVNIRVTN